MLMFSSEIISNLMSNPFVLVVFGCGYITGSVFKNMLRSDRFFEQASSGKVYG